MTCKVCGRDVANENANFCEYCGASFRFNTTVEQKTVNPGVNVQEINKTNEEITDKPISLGHWMLCMILPFIPVLGVYLYPILLVFWSFNRNTSKSKKNWARASLIMYIILVIIFILFGAAIMDFVNSGVPLNNNTGKIL
jgi:uncharacterized membrane protein YvbJ